MQVTAPNLSECTRLWRMIDGDYAAIDWQRDVKSGYRWSARLWSPDITYGTVRGADVKVPWELARFQHLPQLGIAYACASAGAPGFRAPIEYAREFRNQLLDFLATNPRRFGVNWSSTMDVAIRVANILIAYDIFVKCGASIDDAFGAIVNRSIVEHGEHIVQFLEWNPDLRGNHYLANLAGLLYAAVYLPSSGVTDGWLAFAVREMFAEIRLQFNADGSNFEGSTAYHRLSAEIVAYSIALMENIPRDRLARIFEGVYDPPRLRGPAKLTRSSLGLDRNEEGRQRLVPSWIYPLLRHMAEFSGDTVKPSGGIVLFGDNDSGRFVKLHPLFARRTVSEAVSRYANLDRETIAVHGDVYWDEDHQDPSQLMGMVAAQSGDDSLMRAAPGGDFEYELFASPRRTLSKTPDAEVTCCDSPIGVIGSTIIDAVSVHGTDTVTVWRAWSDEESSHRQSLCWDLACRAYPDFGLYIFKSARIYLAIRCGQVGQNGWGGHTHNDQLGFELVVDGSDVFTDPGTYLYSPFPEVRNEYRSVTAHNTPWPMEFEPAALTTGLFKLGDAQRGYCRHWSLGHFIGHFAAHGVSVFRDIEVLDHAIVVRDSSSVPRIQAANRRKPPYAPGYGMVLK